MSTLTAAMNELVCSPQLPDHVRYFQNILADEERRRARFYEDIDEGTKAEFINGEIVVHSPARLEHLHASKLVLNLMHNHVEERGLGEVFVEKCLIRCERNDYEPDICYFAVEKASALKHGQKIFPPPDLIVEILSRPTAKYDRNIKLHDYARHGVVEYWIIDADARVVEQYILEPGVNDYVLRARLSAQSQLASVALAGFVVPTLAFFDKRENKRVLRAILGVDGDIP